MPKSRRMSASVLAALLFLVPFFLSAQEDFNRHYRFPVSLGLEYQSLSPLGDYNVQFRVYDIGLNVKAPLPFAPVLQPTLRVGMVSYTSTGILLGQSARHHLYRS